MLSRTVEALMDIAHDHPLSMGRFIYVDPQVTTTLFDTDASDVFIAEKRTTIRVHKVPYPKLA